MGERRGEGEGLGRERREQRIGWKEREETDREGGERQGRGGREIKEIMEIMEEWWSVKRRGEVLGVGRENGRGIKGGWWVIGQGDVLGSFNR